LDFVYSPPDHSTPRNLNRYYDDDYYRLESTLHRIIYEGEKKPNPKVLLDIVNDRDINGQCEHTIYIGDSLMKDITMAQDASIIDVYAKYGLAQDSDAYELLRKVTHWTEEDVEREKKILKNRTVKPIYMLEESFGQVFDYFEFIPHNPS
jgi:phosphoglycolate phosphatase